MTVPSFIKSSECRAMLALPHSKRTKEMVVHAWKCEWAKRAEDWATFKRICSSESVKATCDEQIVYCNQMAAAC